MLCIVFFEFEPYLKPQFDIWLGSILQKINNTFGFQVIGDELHCRVVVCHTNITITVMVSSLNDSVLNQILETISKLLLSFQPKVHLKFWHALLICRSGKQLHRKNSGHLFTWVLVMKDKGSSAAVHSPGAHHLRNGHVSPCWFLNLWYQFQTSQLL